jgi:hypothetical protein
MVHRHLNHQELTLAAIDDVISRGKRRDWEGLRLAIMADRERVLSAAARLQQ